MMSTTNGAVQNALWHAVCFQPAGVGAPLKNTEAELEAIGDSVCIPTRWHGHDHHYPYPAGNVSAMAGRLGRQCDQLGHYREGR